MFPNGLERGGVSTACLWGAAQQDLRKPAQHRALDLAKGGREHHAGIGRHVLGSQIFDYWKDPWGHVLEHFTDGDLLNADAETGRCEPPIALGTQWGKFGP